MAIDRKQKIINDTIEKKLSLSKLQSSIWEKSSNTTEDEFNLSEMDDDVLQALIQKDLDKEEGDGGYKMS